MNDNEASSPPNLPVPTVEQWSGKDRGDENFPVGSWLIAAPLREHVHAFYAFARNADDIADSATLSPSEKLHRLDIMEEVLLGARAQGSPSAARLKISLARSGVTQTHARELLTAFRQDATKNRYADWQELMQYCRYSAAPVGRYVLDLHGESQDTWPASDSLCASLQVLNHLQDAGPDLTGLDRCYIPQDWLTQAGAATDDIARAATSPGLRLVYDKMLEFTADLNDSAKALPGLVKSRRLRLETATITRLACRLTERLAVGDPLATRVKLTRLDFAGALLRSLGRLA